MVNFEIFLSDKTIPQEDQQAVLQLAAQLDQRWNQRDAKAFADLFEADADFRFFSGAWVKSKAAIETFWKNEVFPGLPSSIQHRSLIKRVRFVSPHLAIGDGTLRFVDDSSGQEQIQSEREATLIAIKKEERWLISAVRLV